MSGGERSVLDLFSAAAGGWSLGMHRAGFQTVAACEAINWRRTLYSENNPGVPVYDDVRTLTAARLLADLGTLPRIVVGSPPCQDISSANTKGKGVEGERSGLFFEAVRIIGEVRPRWFALENSANLRTRGADAVLAALEALGYACWAFVVGADDIGANHERKRSWLIGYDPEQLDGNAYCERGPAGIGHEGGRARRHWPDGDGAPSVAEGAGNPPDPDQAGQADGCMVAGLRQAEIAVDGRGAGRCDDEPGAGQMGLCPPDSGPAFGGRADWSLADLAHHLRLDARLSTWLAGTRVAVGGPRGTAAASLIVEAFGDAVVPQIPEAIGRSILRVEAALAAIYGPASSTQNIGQPFSEDGQGLSNRHERETNNV